MTYREMDNEMLMRYLICSERQMKTLQSTIKQQKEELSRRFDAGELVEKESK